jgi:hypothetical protein
MSIIAAYCWRADPLLHDTGIGRVREPLGCSSLLNALTQLRRAPEGNDSSGGGLLLVPHESHLS